MRRHSTVAAALALVLFGATTTATAATPRTLPSFYRAPHVAQSTAPGTLLKHEVLPDASLDGTTYLVMYVSTSHNGKRVPVTGYVVVPHGTAPHGGWPVLNWSHGTNGMSPSCAPSLDPGSDVTPALINDFLAQGWAFTASDYYGEGTGTLLPYLVGDASAEDSINIVRAAHHLTGADTSTTYVEWGHSEGGQTAAFVDQLSPTYAPDLTLKGVVAGAPPSQFAFIYDFLKSSPYAFYLVMAAGGYHSYYGGAAPLGSILTAAGQRLLPDLSKGCYSYLASTIGGYIAHHSLASIVKQDPFNVPAWKRLLLANDPESFTTASPVPLLIIQGGADEQVPVASTLALYDHLCSIGQYTQRWIYPGQSHSGVIGVSYEDMIHWIADRFANDPLPDTYVPTGLGTDAPATQVCNS